MPAVNDYDLIIIETRPTGATFDKEMGILNFFTETSETTKSKYRSVIEYFDAV